MTPHQEDYLLAIYRLGSEAELVPNKSIADALAVAPASVSEMLSRMSEEGLVENIPYKGTRLTSEGASAVVSLLRSHRLWEVFLVRHLGYSWSEAHEEAHLLEHCAPSRMVDRLDRFLSYPTYCPHGEIIPRNDNVRRHDMRLTALADISPGKRAVVRKVIEEKELLDYLQDSGLSIDAEIFLEKKDPYEGPLTVVMGDQRIRISYKAASQIYVEDAASE